MVVMVPASPGLDLGGPPGLSSGGHEHGIKPVIQSMTNAIHYHIKPTLTRLLKITITLDERAFRTD